MTQLNIMVISIALLFIAESVTYASNDDILNDQDVRDSIKIIEKAYVKAVDITSLEKHCIDAIHKEVSAQSPVDMCITGMVTSLEYSSYLDQDEYRKKAARNVKPPTVTSIYDGEIAYIAIPIFTDKIRDRILETLNGLIGQDRPLAGLIIDLRNCPGGLLSSSVEVAELFLQIKTVIAEVKSHNKFNDMKFLTTFQRFKDEKIKNVLKTVPMVVLVNKNTARGAELLAAALAENDRAIIIGNATAKRGDVQTVIPMANKFILLTSGYLVDPRGNLISENGVRIDIKSQENNLLKGGGQSLEEDPAIKQAYTMLKSIKPVR